MSELELQSTAALIARRQELQFLGCQYGMAGVDAPPELCSEFEAIDAELATRPECNGSGAQSAAE